MTHPVPGGFRLAGTHCGIKSDASKEDLTLIATENDSVAAGVYTTNVVHAACVAQNRTKTPFDRFRVVAVNSGNANACTGDRGDRDAAEMSRLAAKAVGAESDQALVMSTGIIGEYLPMDKIANGIAEAKEVLGGDDDALLAAARGMTTTDKFLKLASATANLDGRPVQVTGIAKGAGMIGPNMATMLCVVMTDAALTPSQAQQLLSTAINQSFNCISVEGHTSTSDTVLLLASGAAGTGPRGDREAEALQQAVTEVCIELARKIPSDGEGASHLITLDVRGCATREDAHRIAKTVAESPLVKTGIAGADPNWGRIVSAAGYAGVSFDPAKLSLSINGAIVYQHGTPIAFDAAAVSASIRDNRETNLELTLGDGGASVRFWTSDLTVDYVRFNSEYTT
jgi:glutamate N-acetyltransferase/amino-acid N-acetyltransferase